MKELARDIQEEYKDSMPGLEIIDHIHTSLSRTVYLKIFQIEPFIAAITKAVKDFKQYSLFPCDLVDSEPLI